MRELNSLPYDKQKSLKVIERMSVHWRTVGYALNIADARIDIIEDDNKCNIENACLTMLGHWLDSNEKPTWHQLIEAIESCSALSCLASDLRNALIQQ